MDEAQNIETDRGNSDKKIKSIECLLKECRDFKIGEAAKAETQRYAAE